VTSLARDLSLKKDYTLKHEFFKGVIFGGILGHTICTGIAVLGGRLLAQRISVRTGLISSKFF